MTINRDIVKALKQLQEKRGFGFRTPEEAAASKTALYARLGFEDVSRGSYSVRDYLEYYIEQFREAFLRPAMVGVGMLLLAVGGWMTSVSAASQSVPGDFLYPIKIASEQAQLVISWSDRDRAELHMEFASRRLAEVHTLSHSDDSEKTAHIKTAVAAFKNEVAEAQTVMQNLGTSDEGAELASALDTKVDEYAATLDQTTATLDTETDVTEEVADAKESAEQVGTEAVEVLVNTVEEAPEKQEVAEDLQESFQKNLAEIDAKVKLTLGRIAVIQQAVDNGVATLPAGVDLRFMTSRLEHFNTQIHQAMNLLAAGGYRKAFEILNEINSTITDVQQQVIDLELSVVAQRDANVDLSPIEELPIEQGESQ